MRRYGESKAHEKAKERIGKILKSLGWTVYIDTKGFRCQTQKGLRTYWPDIYAQNFCWRVSDNGQRARDMAELSNYCNVHFGKASPNHKTGGRRIIVEVESKGGHNTKLAFNNDNLRIQDIRESIESEGKVDYYTVNCRNKKSRNDIRNWTDQDICEELRL